MPENANAPEVKEGETWQPTPELIRDLKAMMSPVDTPTMDVAGWRAVLDHFTAEKDALIARLQAEVAGTADAASIITRRQDEKIKSLQAEVERLTAEKEAVLHDVASRCIPSFRCGAQVVLTEKLNALTDATKEQKG